MAPWGHTRKIYKRWMFIWLASFLLTSWPPSLTLSLDSWYVGIRRVMNRSCILYASRWNGHAVGGLPQRTWTCYLLTRQHARRLRPVAATHTHTCACMHAVREEQMCVYCQRAFGLIGTRCSFCFAFLYFLSLSNSYFPFLLGFFFCCQRKILLLRDCSFIARET